MEYLLRDYVPECWTAAHETVHIARRQARVVPAADQAAIA